MASTQVTAPDPTSVYRYYDRNDVLIYVGITRQGMGRNVQHNGRAEWWTYVARQEVEHYPDRATAAAREKELIRQFRPPFNRQHNLGWAEVRQAYLDFIAMDVPNETAYEQYCRVGKLLPLEVAEHDPASQRLIFRTPMWAAALSSSLRLTKKDTPVRHGVRIATVTKAVPSGPFSYLHCLTNKSCPEMVDSPVRALIGWQQVEKPHYPHLRQILAGREASTMIAASGMAA